MIIAVDFDGTIVEDRFPDIGEPRIFAFETLKELQKNKHQILLWTTREGLFLDEAVEFCRKNGVEFHAVNNSFPGEKFDGTYSRKLNCEIFISHRNIGGIPGWGEMYQEVKAVSGQGLHDESIMRKETFFERIANLIWKS